MDNLQAFFAQNVQAEITEDCFEEVKQEVRKLIEKGDAGWNYAYYALYQFNIFPWDFAKLNKRQKASLIAMIDINVESKK